MAVNNLQVLIGEPDCFRNWVEVAVDIGTEYGRVEADKGVLDCVALFLQKNNHVVETQAQVISILGTGKHG